VSENKGTETTIKPIFCQKNGLYTNTYMISASYTISAELI